MVPFLALPIVIAILFSVATAGDRGLWLDELYTFAASDPGLSLATLLRTQMSVDTNPPLYYVAAHGWTLLFGTSEIAYRSLSLLFAVLTLPAAFFLGRQLDDRETSGSGAAVAALVCTAPAFVIYAQEARAYTMLLFTSTALLAATCRVLQSVKSRSLDMRFLAFQSAVMAVAGLTHYFGYLVAGMAGLATLFVAWRTRHGLLRIMLAYSAPGAILIGWFLSHVGRMQYDRNPLWFEPDSRATLFFFYQTAGLLWGMAGVLAVAASCAYALMRSPHAVARELQRPEAVLMIVVAAGVALSAFVLAWFTGTPVNTPISILKARYFIVLLPPAAALTWAVLRTTPRSHCTVLVAICVLALLGSAIYARENRSSLPWQEPGALIRSHPDCTGMPILTLAYGHRTASMYLYYTEPVRPVFVPVDSGVFTGNYARLRFEAAEALASPCPVKFWGAHLSASAVAAIGAAFKTIDSSLDTREYGAGGARHILVVKGNLLPASPSPQ